MGLPKDSGFDLHSRFANGERNLITDVPGVRVGHATLHAGDIHTGVTAILPPGEDWFHRKCFAGCRVLNGFGKTAGLVQIDELGTLEAPILMTNTLSVGTALTGMVRIMLERNPDICVTNSSVNCVVTECNDAHLNDIRGLHVTEEHVRQAVESASGKFAEGAVGGGAGMCCLGFKGGIGSASRTLSFGGETFTVGSIAVTNFGSAGNLVIGGRHVGEELDESRLAHDRGSVIFVTATDLPLSPRQLKRLSSRASAALGRVGSTMGNGSGDISIAFSSGNIADALNGEPFQTYRFLSDTRLDSVFAAAIEAMEESVVSSLWHAETVEGIRGNRVRGFREVWENREK